MQEAEQRSGIDYEVARRDYDHQVDPLGYTRGEEAVYHKAPSRNEFERYQQAARQVADDEGLKGWDSVASCYMLHGRDIREVPWDGNQSEIDAFVQEELVGIR